MDLRRLGSAAAAESRGRVAAERAEGTEAAIAGGELLRSLGAQDDSPFSVDGLGACAHVLL
jgi:hypothetical protein